MTTPRAERPNGAPSEDPDDDEPSLPLDDLAARPLPPLDDDGEETSGDRPRFSEDSDPLAGDDGAPADDTVGDLGAFVVYAGADALVGDEPHDDDEPRPALDDPDHLPGEEELVAGDEHGLLRDTDEPDGRDIDADEAGIDAREETSADDGTAEGTSEDPAAILETARGETRSAALVALSPPARALLEHELGGLELAAVIADSSSKDGYFAAIVDEDAGRCRLVRVDDRGLSTLATIDIDGLGSVLALERVHAAESGAIDAVVVVLTRDRKLVPFASAAIDPTAPG